MPNTREKLIELLETVVSPNEVHCDGEVLVSTSRIADHLIANGVTVGKLLTEYLHPVVNYAGLKGKYLVFKADTGEQVSNCFVLRPDKDTAAVEALRAYARNTNNETLAEDIYNWVGKGVTVQKWIPVAERLPEEEGWYLVYTTPNREHKSINKAMFCKGYAWGNFEPYWRGAGGHWANVTHWMPLPEPPKGE